MGNKKAIFAITTTALTAAGTFVACGSDKAAPIDGAVVIHDSPVDTKVIDAAPDAPSFDFSCAGNNAPNPATNVTISGAVIEAGFNGSLTYGPRGSADVTLCEGNCSGSNALGSDVTDGSGSFSFGPLPTNGSALDGYVRVSYASDRTILGFPASPIATDVVQPIITFQNALISGLGSIPGGCTQDDGSNGMIGVLVTDCSTMPINDANVTVGVMQNGSAVGDAPIDIGSFFAQAAGFYLICNVPPGATTVTAKYKTTDLRQHDVQVTTGTTTETIIRPGF